MSFHEKLPSKKLGRLLERYCVLYEKVHLQVCKEYPIETLCEFRNPDGSKNQLRGYIVEHAVETCNIVDTDGNVHRDVDLYDVRRFERKGRHGRR